MHGVKDVAIVGIDLPGEEATQLVGQHILAFRLDRALIVIGDQLTGGGLEQGGRFGGLVVVVLPACAHMAVDDVAIVQHAIFPGALDLAGGGAGEGIIALISAHPFPAATVGGGTDHQLPGVDPLRQQLLHRCISVVALVGRAVGGLIEVGLMTQGGIAPGTVVVVTHHEEVIHVLLGSLVIHILNLVVTGTDGGGELIGATGLGLQLVEHGAQILHDQHIGFPIFGLVPQIGVGTVAARELIVDIDTVEELPGLQELFDRGDEHVTLGLVMHEEEGVGKGPATDGGEDLQVRIGLFEGHQIAEVALVGLIPGDQ